MKMEMNDKCIHGPAKIKGNNKKCATFFYFFGFCRDRRVSQMLLASVATKVPNVRRRNFDRSAVSFRIKETPSCVGIGILGNTIPASGCILFAALGGGVVWD